MNLGQLVRSTRTLLTDTSDYNRLFSDEEIKEALNEALIQACRNARLLKTSSLSLGETRASCEITIFGTSGIINSIIIDGLNIISNPITYTSNDNTTVALLSNEINDTGIFESTVVNNLITLRPIEGFGAYFNNITPIIEQTNLIATTSSLQGGIDGIARITLKRNKKEYQLSDKIIKIEDIRLGEKEKTLCMVHYKYLSDHRKQELTKLGEPCTVIYGMGNNNFRLGKIPAQKDFLNLTVYHLPLEKLINNSDVPPIKEHYHLKLIHYALYHLFMKNDIEVDEKELAMFHLQRFQEEFNDNAFGSASQENDLYSFFEGN